MDRSAKRSRIDINFINPKNFSQQHTPPFTQKKEEPVKKYEKEIQNIKKSLKRIENNQKNFTEKYNEIFEKQRQILEMCDYIIESIKNTMKGDREEDSCEVDMERLNLNEDCSYIS